MDQQFPFPQQLSFPGSKDCESEQNYMLKQEEDDEEYEEDPVVFEGDPFISNIGAFYSEYEVKNSNNRDLYFIAGRGGETNLHKANRVIRAMILERLPDYLEATKSFRGKAFCWHGVLRSPAFAQFRFVVRKAYFDKNRAQGKISKDRVASVLAEHEPDLLSQLPDSCYLNIGAPWSIGIVQDLLREAARKDAAHPCQRERRAANKLAKMMIMNNHSQSCGGNSKMSLPKLPPSNIPPLPPELTPSRWMEKAAATAAATEPTLRIPQQQQKAAGAFSSRRDMTTVGFKNWDYAHSETDAVDPFEPKDYGDTGNSSSSGDLKRKLAAIAMTSLGSSMGNKSGTVSQQQPQASNYDTHGQNSAPALEKAPATKKPRASPRAKEEATVTKTASTSTTTTSHPTHRYGTRLRMAEHHNHASASLQPVRGSSASDHPSAATTIREKQRGAGTIPVTPVADPFVSAFSGEPTQTTAWLGATELGNFPRSGTAPNPAETYFGACSAGGDLVDDVREVLL